MFCSLSNLILALGQKASISLFSEDLSTRKKMTADKLLHNFLFFFKNAILQYFTINNILYAEKKSMVLLNLLFVHSVFSN